jgi:hypothetical protein
VESEFSYSTLQTCQDDFDFSVSLDCDRAASTYCMVAQRHPLEIMEPVQIMGYVEGGAESRI